jgi:hypothetical protein
VGRIVLYADQEMGRLDAHWAGYLAGVAAALHDVATECIVRFGDPADEIVAEAETWGAELVAIQPPAGVASDGSVSVASQRSFPGRSASPSCATKSASRRQGQPRGSIRSRALWFVKANPRAS